MIPPIHSRSFAFVVLLFVVPFEAMAAETLGLFEGAVDIGAPKHAGSAQYDALSQHYKVTGGGANMWFTNVMIILLIIKCMAVQGN